MKVQGFLKDVTGASRVTKRRLDCFENASDVFVKNDPINNVARELHPEEITFVVDSIRDASPTAKTFRLVSKDVKLPVFQAGQYVSLQFKVGETLTTRPYSISSAPFETRTDNAFIEITIRCKGDNFIPDFLFNNVKVGSTLIGSMPYGHFYYEPLRDSKNVVALAGGSGITPFVSMAREIKSGKLDFNMTILYGSEKQDDIILRDVLDNLDCDKVKVVHVLSGDDSWTGEKGFLNKEIIEKYSSEDTTYFICGPQVMYKFVEGELKTLGIKRRRIRREVFGAPKNISKAPGFPESALGKTVEITVTRGIQKDVIKASCEEPVVVALERAGIPIITDCRSGECGFCRSQLLGGEIFVPADGDGRRMMDKEWGYFHPCSSYPISDLTIKIPII